MSGQKQNEQVPDINNLQEALNKQQKKISALKELVRKSDSTQGSKTSTSEKVKNIAQRLTHLKAKAQGGRHQKQQQQQQQQPIDDSSEVQTSPLYPDDDSLLNFSDVSQHQQLVLAPALHNPEGHSIVAQIPSKHSAFTASPMPLRAQQRSVSNTSLSSASTGTEKLLLLRQQMEENKALMARRASSKQHLELLVSQLKENFDTTQQSLENTTTELGKSMNDLSIPNYSGPLSIGSGITVATSARERHRSATDLSTQPAFSLEKERIKFLENRCRLLEKQLEKERLAASEGGNNLETAAALEASSKRIKELENKVIELEQAEQSPEPQDSPSNELQIENERLRHELDDLLARRQETVGDAEADFSDLALEVSRLREENAIKAKRIAELEEINDLLETTRCDLSSKLNSYEIKIQELENELKNSEENLATTTSDLEKLKSESETVSENRKEDDSFATTDERVQAEMAKQIQILQDENKRLLEENEKLLTSIAESEKLEVSDNQIAEKIKSLEATLEAQREDLALKQEINRKQEEELMEKTIELNVLNANFRVLEEKLQALNKNKSKPLFASQTAASSDFIEAEKSDQNAEIEDLKQKLDEANKMLIKLKLKAKQSEKQVEQMKKSSKVHEDLANLQKQNDALQQHIAKLEEANATKQSSVGREEEEKSEKSADVRQLEVEKSELQSKLASLQKEFDEQRGKVKREERVVVARVETELNEIHLEEQVAEQQEQIATLQKDLSSKDDELKNLSGQVEQLKDQKQTLEKKLQHYISENIELLDKVEKLSKSSSSAESIEIVDRLTQQEHAEMAEFNKRLTATVVTGNEKELTAANLHEHEQQHLSVPTGMSSSAPSMTTSFVNELTQTDMGEELSESLTKLREESSELMDKVELFTRERREVLDKMEALKKENVDLQNRIETLNLEKTDIESELLEVCRVKESLEMQLDEVSKEKNSLVSQIAETSAQKSDLSRELTSMQKSSEIVAALDNTADCTTLFDKCEKSLTSLQNELEAYKRAHDKNSKFNASKKLAKEAKNAHAQLSELLTKVKEASTAVETVTVVETVVAVTAPNGKALAEYEQLNAQNRELKNKVDELQKRFEALESVRESSAETAEDEAISSNANRIENEEAVKKLQDYETECAELRLKVEDLTAQLRRVNEDQEVKGNEITRLNDELNQMQKMSQEFDEIINKKEMSHEQQIEKLTRLRKELEAKCDTYHGEMEILQTLVTEQKQQLIEAYKENEYEINMKLLDLQQRDELITHLRSELEEMRKHTQTTGIELTDNLQKECEKLREALRINKKLLAEQVDELSNKQETIDTLNQQIIDLYKTMEDNTNKLIEKEDEMADLQEKMDANEKELDRLRKDNEEQKVVVDKLLLELHTEKESRQHLKQLESEVNDLKLTNKQLEDKNHEFEKRNKEQLEKLKKFAANLKKRAAQNQELEAKVKALEEKNAEPQQAQAQAQAPNELQQDLEANVVLLNERIADYEIKLKTHETSLVEVREALQTKTVEFLEIHEKCQNFEHKVGQLEENVKHKNEKISELQDKLRDSEKLDDTWGHDDFTFGNIDSLSKQMEKNEEDSIEVQRELKEARETMLYKEETLKEVYDELESLKAEVKTQKSKTESLESSYKERLSSLQEQFDAQSQRLSEVSEELKNKSLKFEKSKAVIKDRNNQIHRLQAQLKELQSKLSQLPEEEIAEEISKVNISQNLAQTPSSSKSQDSTVSRSEFDALEAAHRSLTEKYTLEKSNFEQTIARLETVHAGIQAKLHEDMAYIESLEQENSKFKEKICKLEECVASFEERRASMERRANVLNAEMQSRVDKYEQSEDELIYRLNALSEHDDVIAQRLLDSQEEKDELQDRLDKLHLNHTDLSTRYARLEKEYKSLKESMANDHETEVQELRTNLTKSEAELKRLRGVYDAKLAAKTTELDELENELSDQLERMNTEKRNLTEDLEKSRDECNALKDEVMRLNDSLNTVEQAKQESDRELTWLRMQNDNAQQDQYELQELRMQSIQDKTEIDNLRHQIETLATNHQTELDSLRIQISELDSLRMQVGQNQTDDQVFIESENKRLTELLAEKETIIKNYQRQYPHLQVIQPNAESSGTAATPAHSRENEFSHFENEVNQQQLHHQLVSMRVEIESLTEANDELQRQLADKQREIDQLKHSSQHNQQHQQQQQQQQPPLASAAFAPRSQPCDIIPAPPMFFSGLQAAPSPFDEIVAHSQDRMAASAHAPDVVASRIEQQPTIEDLQRNVSDLEKHAQDLEIKLSQRTHYAEELRERLNEAQIRINILEREANTNGSKLQETLQRLAALENQRVQQEPTHAQQQGEELKAKDAEIERLNELLNATRTQLDASEDHIKELQTAIETERRLAEGCQALESQIIADPFGDSQNDSRTTAEKEIFKRDVAPTLDMFFGNSTAPAEFENVIVPQIPEVSKEPVNEDPIIPEKAYVCFPDGGNNEFNDGGNDGWGNTWGFSDVPVQEPAISQRMESTSQATQPQMKSVQSSKKSELNDLQQNIFELENQLTEQRQLTKELQSRLLETERNLEKAEQTVKSTTEQLAQATHNTQEINVLQQNIAAIDQRAQLAESQLVERDQRLHEMNELLASMLPKSLLEELQLQLDNVESSLLQRNAELEAVKKELNEERRTRQQEEMLQSQIIPKPDAENEKIKRDVGLTLDAFFGNAPSSDSPFDNITVVSQVPPVSDKPVCEAPVVPEKAYLCYPTAETTSVTSGDVSSLGLTIPEDDWTGGDVWSTQEATAEAAHFQQVETVDSSRPINRQQSLLSHEQQLEIQVQEQNELIQKLQKSLQDTDQERQDLHVKSSKLMKKLKEYKAKYDELQQQQSAANFRKSSSIESDSRSGSMFDDLDAAIQDELKKQIAKLESDLDEQRKLQDNINLEKEKLLKRIDVLTAGNERMSEMKERQDLDVQMYQARIKELQEKLNALENWDTESNAASSNQQQSSNDTSQKMTTEQQAANRYLESSNNLVIEALKSELEDNKAEKQELQDLLDEEKRNLQEAEKNLQMLRQQLTTTNNASDDLNEVTSRLVSLQDSYEKLNKTYMEQAQQMQHMGTLHKDQEQQLAKLSEDLLRSESDLVVLREELRTKEQALKELREELDTLKLSQQQQQNQQQDRSEIEESLQALKAENLMLQEKTGLMEKQLEEQKLNQTLNTSEMNENLAEELAAQLREKESEILHLKQRIEDLMREDQTEKLVLEILTKNQEIHLLKIKVKDLEDERQELEHNLSLQITKEMQSDKQKSEDSSNSDKDEVIIQLQSKINSLEEHLKALQSEKSNMEQELQVLNTHVLKSLELEDKLRKAALELDMKNIEIIELRKSLETMKGNSMPSATPTVPAEPQVDVTALNASWEAIVEQRCGEIAQMWRLHTEQRETEFKQIEQRLQEQIANLQSRLNSEPPADAEQRAVMPQHPHHPIVDSSATSATSTPVSGVSTSQSIVESATSSGADSKNDTPLRIINEADADALIEKMQAALESQEMEIVSLKEQLAIRSAEYAHLAAQHDPYNLKSASRGNLDSPSRRTSATSNSTESNAALVPKHELDLALYVLHQRDMRCEEMTLELVSLLEERDTLQLKLSNTLRQMEAIKAQFNYIEPSQSHTPDSSLANIVPITTATASSSSSAPLTESPNSSAQQTIAQGSAALISEESAEELKQKLSQLQTVNHSKDKLIKEERERRNRQMAKIQEDVAKIPPAAVSELIGSDISQSNQTPSSALLNWLWGNKPLQPMTNDEPNSSPRPNNN